MNAIKKLTLFLLIALISLFPFSCRKEEEAPVTNEYMQATINGLEFSAADFVVARASVTTSINGTLGPYSNAESIGISIENAKVGSFSLSENTDYFAVYKSTTDEFMSASGTLQITSMTAEWIEGSFSFKAHSMNDPAAHIIVSEGKFKMRLD
jgi:hypothetical protein